MAASAAKLRLGGEVRLFARVATLDGLLAEASARFGVPLRPRLTYRDTEGDELTVTTSEELLLALGAAAASGGRAPLLEAERADEDWEFVDAGAASLTSPSRPQEFATSLTLTVNGQEHSVQNPEPSKMLVDFLRNDLGLTGTKVACGEGGCGSCVVSATGPGGPVVSLNSCLRPLCAMDGWSVTTVEGLKGSAAAAAGGQGCCRGAAGAAHPIQQKLADGDGVQCGFCSPGWVMSMYALLEKGGSTTLEEIEQHCDGNLCRCTGYRPILQAFHALADQDAPDVRHRSSGPGRPSVATEPPVARAPLRFCDPARSHVWYSVFSLEQLSSVLKEAGPKACFIGANTGVRGVLKYLDNPAAPAPVTPEVAIDVSRVKELASAPEFVGAGGGKALRAPAATPLSALIAKLESQEAAGLPFCATLAGHLRRIAGVHVRNVGTWAGNLALARRRPQFVSDLAPALAALGASLTVLRPGGALAGEATATVSAEDYLLQAPEDDQTLLVEALIPLSAPAHEGAKSVFHCFKTASRHVNSHSIVNCGALLSFLPRARTCVGARVFVGGLAAQGLLRATAVESVLRTSALSEDCLDRVYAALDSDVARCGGASPEPRQSPGYRLALARAHLRRLLLLVLQADGALPEDCVSALEPFCTAAARPPLAAVQSYAVDKAVAPVSEAVTKFTALESATGRAIYPSDRHNMAPNTLHGAFALADQANRKLVAIDPTEALSVPGVVGFLTAADVPRGALLVFDEPLFVAAGEVVPYAAGRVGFVVAETEAAAREGARRVRLTWGEPPGSRIIHDLEAAMESSTFFGAAEIEEARLQSDKLGGLRRRCIPLHRARRSAERHDEPRGAQAGLQKVEGHVDLGGTSHWYFEPQTALVIPTEGSIEVWTGDQNPVATQQSVSSVLQMPLSDINVRVKRVGGGFGGKLMGQTRLAAACALAAVKWGRPTFASNERVLDMRLLGGREPIKSDYEAEFDGDGKLSKIQMRFHMDVGCFLGDADDDLSMAIGFSDNAFYCPSFKCDGVPYMTHTMHRTSQRAPGVLQSICSMQVILEHISRSLKLPFELVQEKNFYSAGQQTPFGDTLGSDVYNWTLPELWQQLKRDADFDTRSSAVDTFNSANRWRKRGIAMVPCKYVMGLSDYNMNALVNVYSDGSVLVAHGGCEIGQGIHTKVAQAVAYTLGVDLKYVQVADTETSKTPGNACTGGSGTSESCSQAAINAAQVLKDRLASYRTGGKSWPEAAMAAAQAKENLSAEGFFKGAASAENAHTYAVYGAGMSEVEVDVLTGEMEILRVDILMDLGRQLNAAVDIGQLEGGFVMALGYFFTEELKFDEQARPLNLGTWEYKIPSAFDIPREFNVSIMKPVLNPSGVLGSKACAEPVMPLAASAYFAVKQAVGAARKQLGLGDGFFDLPVPATVECIQQACAPQGGGGVPTGVGA